MALFSKSPKVNPEFAPTTEVLDAADALSAALDARMQIDAAIAKNDAARAAAGDTRQVADAEVERLEVALALCLDEEKIAAVEITLASARAASANATAVTERADRLRGNLHRAAQDADTAIAAARQAFQTAIGTFGREVSEVLAGEAREAAQHLVKVLMRSHAVASSLGTLSQGTGFLGATTIPSPAPGQQAIIGTGRADLADGTRIDLAATWRDDPSATALADLLKPLADLRRRAAQHATFVPPRPAAKPYETSPANRTAALHNAEIDAREGPWKPPAGTFNPQVSRIGDHSQPQRVDINPAAGVADRAVAELGGAA